MVFKKGNKLWKLRKIFTLSEETKRKMSEAHKGQKAWNKGKKCPHLLKNTNGFKKGQIPWNKGKKMSKETKRKLSKSLEGRKLSKEHIRKVLRRREMSSLEIKMNEIIKNNKLPYKFVGNGEFMLGRKCPDFVNCNGEKKAVEVYYRRHKQMFRNGLEQWKTSREKIFKEYGWSLLFFDETQVNEKMVLEKLGEDDILQ